MWDACFLRLHEAIDIFGRYLYSKPTIPNLPLTRTLQIETLSILAAMWSGVWDPFPVMSGLQSSRLRKAWRMHEKKKKVQLPEKTKKSNCIRITLFKGAVTVFAIFSKSFKMSLHKKNSGSRLLCNTRHWNYFLSLPWMARMHLNWNLEKEEKGFFSMFYLQSSIKKYYG